MEGLGPPQTGQLARNRLLHGGDVGCGVDEDPYVGVGLLSLHYCFVCTETFSVVF